MSLQKSGRGTFLTTQNPHFLNFETDNLVCNNRQLSKKKVIYEPKQIINSSIPQTNRLCLA